MFKQRTWVEYLNEHALLEAKVKDVKKQYPKLTELGWLDWFRQNLNGVLGTKGVSKYLQWTMRELTNNYSWEGEEELEDLKPASQSVENKAIADALMEAVLAFERNQQRMEEKDIYRYNSAELEAAIRKIEEEDTQKQARAKEKEKALAGSEIIYDDNNVFAVRPKTEASSCYYGRNTKWCISATETQNYFQQYTEEGKGFVMVRVSGLPTDHKFHKITVVFSQHYSGHWEAEEIFDVFDTSYDDIDVLYEALTEAGIQKQIAAEIYQEIIENGTASFEEDPPESGMEDKAEEIMKQYADSHSQNFQPYYDVDNDGTRDYLNFGASYYFSVPADQLTDEEIPAGWGGEAQELMDDIREILDTETQYYVAEVEVDDGREGGIEITLRANDEGYDPNPNGFDSFLASEGVDPEKSRDIQKVLKHLMRDKGYMKQTPISILQKQVEEEQETRLSKLESFKVDHNDHEGLFLSLEKRFILFNGNEIGLDKIPKGYKGDWIAIDISDGLDDNLGLDYLRPALGKPTRAALRFIGKEADAVAAATTKQMDLPIKDLPPKVAKKFPMISKKLLGIKAVTIQGTSLGDHAIAYDIAFALRHGPFGMEYYKSVDNEELYIDEVVNLAEYIDKNLDIVGKGLKNFMIDRISNPETPPWDQANESINSDVQDYFSDINEEQDRSRQRGIYRFYCMIGYNIKQENRRGLEDILTDIRAIEHVTVVAVMVSNEKISETQYVAGLALKYTPSTRGEFNSPEEIRVKIIRTIKRVPGVRRIYKVSSKIERIE